MEQKPTFDFKDRKEQMWTMLKEASNHENQCKGDYQHKCDIVAALHQKILLFSHKKTKLGVFARFFTIHSSISLLLFISFSGTHLEAIKLTNTQ